MIYAIFTSFALLCFNYMRVRFKDALELKRKQEFLDEKPTTEWFKNNFEDIFVYMGAAFYYIVWLLFGLFSNQWVIHVVLIVMSNTYRLFFKKLSINNPAYITFSYTIFYIQAALIIFAIVNSVHLHIDLFKMIIQWF